MFLAVAMAGGEPLGAAVPRVARQSTQDGGCRVPDLRGLDQRAAVARLQQADLRPRVEKRRSTRPTGTVIDQRPQPCGSLADDRTVYLVVSSGEASGETAPPASGSGGDLAVPIAIGAGAAIIGAIVASRRNATVEVPDLLKQAVPAARETLSKSRLTIGEVGLRPSASTTGTIIEQTPRPGARVARDTAIHVVLSSGLPMTVVPDLIDRPRSDAETLVARAQLRLLPPDQSGPSDPGLRVVSQVPAAGTRVVVGAAVAVALQAPAPPPAPAVAPPQEPPVAAVAPPPLQSPALPQAAPATIPAPAPTSPPSVATPVVTPVLPSAPATAPPAPVNAVPAQPLTPSPGTPDAVAVPPPQFSRWWLWLLLLLPVVARMARRTPDRESELHAREPFTLPPPRVVVLPHLDAGTQVITSMKAGDARTFDIRYHSDPGTQRIHVHRSGAAS